MKRLGYSQSTWYVNPKRKRRLRDQAKFSLQSLDLKYILNQGSENELYDLRVDPHERRNLIAEPDYWQQAAGMKKTLVSMMEVLSDPDFQAESVDDETLERLRSLGYLE